MPDYTSLATEIAAIKTEIGTSVAASVYSAQDLVYLASALDTLGGMLGVNDIVTATADKIAEVNTAKTTALSNLETKRVNSLADVNADRATALADIDSAKTTALNQISGASTNFNVLFLGSII
jgi:hypothetical protein